MFFGNFFAVHNSVGVAALDSDGLRDGELDSFFDFEHGGVSGHDWQERHVHSFRDNWTGPNYPIPHFQTGVFQPHL